MVTLEAFQTQPTFTDRLRSVLNVECPNHATLDTQVERLQAIMARASADQLDELATTVSKLCEPQIHDSSLITFIWIRKHLSTVVANIEKSERFARASDYTYSKCIPLFKETNFIPCIHVGRGGVESVALKAAAGCLRNNGKHLQYSHESDLFYEGMLAFGNGYIRSVVAGILYPFGIHLGIHRACALLMLGQQLLAEVGDYKRPNFNDATVHAKDICTLLPTTTTLCPKSDQTWLGLGLIYAAAVRYIAEDPAEMQEARQRVQPSGLPSAFLFMRHAISCFKGGCGDKGMGDIPIEKWRACQEPGQEQRCVDLVAEIQDATAGERRN